MKTGFCTLILVLAVMGAGCGSSIRDQARPRLSQSAALLHAVTLANDECMARYSVAPFDTSSYAINFRGGRWHWGYLDPKGKIGFSAVVSFDAYGEDPIVEVVLSTDMLTPTRNGREPEQD